MTSPRKPSKSTRRKNALAETQAFSAFFDQVHLQVYRYIFALLGGPQQTVEDLTAEAFTRAWQARETFSGDQQDGLRWVLRIARNLVIDTHRRERRRMPESDIDAYDLPSSSANPEEQIVWQETSERLLTALGQLPDNQHEMLVLRYVLGWRVKDIAGHLQMAENTVSVNLRRALERIRRHWPEP